MPSYFVQHGVAVPEEVDTLPSRLRILIPITAEYAENT
jgi:hypothetical protein